MSKYPTRELHHYSMFLVNLCYLLLFLTLGFGVLPVISSQILATEIRFIASVLGTALIAYALNN